MARLVLKHRHRSRADCGEERSRTWRRTVGDITQEATAVEPRLTPPNGCVWGRYSKERLSCSMYFSGPYQSTTSTTVLCAKRFSKLDTKLALVMPVSFWTRTFCHSQGKLQVVSDNHKASDRCARGQQDRKIAGFEHYGTLTSTGSKLNNG